MICQKYGSDPVALDDLPALLSFSTPAQAFNGVDVIKVFAGIMDGILHKDNLNYLLGCMTGTDALVVDVQTVARAPPVNEIAELPKAMKHEGNMPNLTHYALLKSSSAHVI